MSGAPNWLVQLVFFVGVAVLQVFGFFVMALGCGDDGAVDYGTATDLQRQVCRVAYRYDRSGLDLFFFAGPLVFALAAIAAPRSRFGPLLLALPFVAVTSVPVLIAFVPAIVALVAIPLAAVAVTVWAKRTRAQ